MTMRFRKRPEPPARKPHPDARVEAELQRIISLRRAVTRTEALLAADHEQIAKLRDTIARHPNWDGLYKRKDQVNELLNEADDLDEEIQETHDEIAKRIAALSDSDLAWLEAS